MARAKSNRPQDRPHNVTAWLLRRADKDRADAAKRKPVKRKIQRIEKRSATRQDSRR